MLRGGRVVCGCEHTSRAYDTSSAALRRSVFVLATSASLSLSRRPTVSRAHAAPSLRSSAGSRAARRGGDEEALPRRASLALLLPLTAIAHTHTHSMLSLSLSSSP